GLIGKIGDVPQHACQHQATPGYDVFVVVPAAVEFRIADDGLTRHLVESDVLCGKPGSGGNDHGLRQALRIIDCPLHDLHSAHAAANHRGPALYTELLAQDILCPHPIADRDDRKVGSIVTTGCRVDAARACGTVVATQVAWRNDEEAIGI